MIAHLTKETKTYVHCPECGDECSSVDHIMEGFKSKWYCDNCGVRYIIRMKNNTIEVEATEERKIQTFVFLKSNDIGLIVKGMRFEPSIADGSEYESNQHYYDQGTCPTNYLSEVLAVVDLGNGDCDPHGIFKFKGVKDFPADFNEGDCNYDYSRFLDFFNPE